MSQESEYNVSKPTSDSEKGQQIKWPGVMRGEVAVVQICQEARNGKFVDPESLAKIDFRARLNRQTDMGEFHRRAYQRSIFFYGEDALAHLCLPVSYLLWLEIGGVETISQLEQTIQQGTLQRIRHIGPKTEARIIRLVQEWSLLPDPDNRIDD